MFKIKRKTTEIDIKGHKGYNVKVYLTLFGYIYKLKFEYNLLIQNHRHEYNDNQILRKTSIFTLSSNTEKAYQEWRNDFQCVGYFYNYVKINN